MAKMRQECFVFVYLPGQVQAVPAGRLTIAQNGRDIASTFVYGNRYRARPDAIALDPIELPLGEKQSEVLRPLRGNALFGALRDAAPDAWGRLVINDRWARRHQVDGISQSPNSFDLPEMEYLLRSRNDRVGALDFREKVNELEPSRRLSGVINLGGLVKEAHRISRNEPATVEVTTLLHPATGMGGARPKTSIEDDEGLWLAKFPMEGDRMPVTRIENAMLELATRCGITTPEHKLMPIEVGDPVLMIKRFDRDAAAAGGPTHEYKRTAYLSALTAMGKDEFSQSSASYQDVGNFLRRRGAAGTQSAMRKELFRRLVFNVLVNNDDDHLRNHGFLRNKDASYSLAPAFDMVPRLVAPGMGMQRRQAIGVGKLGRDGTLENMLSDLAPFDLDKEEARQIMADVACVVQSQWRQVMEESGVDEKTQQDLEPIMDTASEVLQELEVTCESDRPCDRPQMA